MGTDTFYAIVDAVAAGETLGQCPPIKNLVTGLLESLGTRIVANQPSQSRVILDRMIAKPQLAQFISPYFAPRTDDSQAFLSTYKAICDINESEANLAFVLMSKVNLDEWMSRSATNSILYSLLFAKKKLSFDPSLDFYTLEKIFKLCTMPLKGS